MNWRLAVLGYPVSHSLSPQLHEAGLALAGLAGSSQRVEVREDEFSRVTALLGPRLDAASVTMPLKGVVASVCDRLDAVATRTGMVNSLWWHDGRLYGANTDGQGLLDALSDEFRFDASGTRVVVLGAGGAARSIVDALSAAGADEVVVHARNAANLDWLVQHYDAVRPPAGRTEAMDLVVNTVPVAGRDEDEDVLDGVGPETIAVDITYSPRTSPWRALYDAVGCATTNGLAMLAYQAARQMQWWFQTPIDGATLLEAVT
jgi:shikimate dehydrogenase